MELETGKWYIRAETGTYFKYEKLVNKTVEGSECIQKVFDNYVYRADKKFSCHIYYCTLKEVSIEEIKQYLPHDHPDLKSPVNPLQDDNMNLLKLLQLHEIK